MNATYGESYSAHQQGAGGRGSTENIDELVKRNIQDVLQAANLLGAAEDEQQGGPSYPSTSQPVAPDRLNARVLPAARQGSLGRAPDSAGRRRSDGLGAEPSSSGVSLDVPGNSEATLRLHKARIRGLEDEVAKLTQALTEHDKQLADAKRETRNLKMEQATWSKTQKGLEAQVEKLRCAAADASAALAAKEAALKELGREGGKADRERRQGDAEAKVRDVRLQRALEEVDKYKQMLQEVKLQEREGKDVAKSDYHRVVADNKRLERQRAELIVAFKKQLKLIDVLKRQKLHLEAARALQFTEQEFLQTLEMGNS